MYAVLQCAQRLLAGARFDKGVIKFRLGMGHLGGSRHRSPLFGIIFTFIVEYNPKEIFKNVYCILGLRKLQVHGLVFSVFFLGGWGGGTYCEDYRNT